MEEGGGRRRGRSGSEEGRGGRRGMPVVGGGRRRARGELEDGRFRRNQQPFSATASLRPLMVETEPLLSARRLHFNKSQSFNLFLSPSSFFFYKIKNWVFLNLVYE